MDEREVPGAGQDLAGHLDDLRSVLGMDEHIPEIGLGGEVRGRKSRYGLAAVMVNRRHGMTIADGHRIDVARYGLQQAPVTGLALEERLLLSQRDVIAGRCEEPLRARGVRSRQPRGCGALPRRCRPRMRPCQCPYQNSRARVCDTELLEVGSANHLRIITFFSMVPLLSMRWTIDFTEMTLRSPFEIHGLRSYAGRYRLVGNNANSTGNIMQDKTSEK